MEVLVAVQKMVNENTSRSHLALFDFLYADVKLNHEFPTQQQTDSYKQSIVKSDILHVSQQLRQLGMNTRQRAIATVLLGNSLHVGFDKVQKAVQRCKELETQNAALREQISSLQAHIGQIEKINVQLQNQQDDLLDEYNTLQQSNSQLAERLKEQVCAETSATQVHDYV